jgi:hypothetical protein
VDLKRLEEIVATPALANNNDLNELLELSKQYPYAHYLKTLISKVAQHVHDIEQINKLNTAAIYSADRNILKKVITDPDYTIYLPLPILDVHNQALRSKQPDVPPVISPPTDTRAPAKITRQGNTITDSPATPDKKATGGGIFNEVMRNLDKLKSLRKKYTFLEKKEDEALKKTEEQIRQAAARVPRDKEMEASAGPMPTSEDLRIPASKDEEVKTAASPDQTRDTPSPIPDKPAEVKPEPKVELAYQKQLIDEFINRKITAPGPNQADALTDTDQEDLSVQNLEYESNIVSETLAKIYKKQGKTEKAVDIYKKLIWKYPQKKAYFAARIEDLKG